jgi:hypothetical protein
MLRACLYGKAAAWLFEYSSLGDFSMVMAIVKGYLVDFYSRKFSVGS